MTSPPKDSSFRPKEELEKRERERERESLNAFCQIWADESMGEWAGAKFSFVDLRKGTKGVEKKSQEKKSFD